MAVCLVMFMSQIKADDGQAVLVLLGPQSIRSCCNLKPEITGIPTAERLSLNVLAALFVLTDEI